ncbi:MAG: hypothetical protein Kow00121_46420 [Elainellaceae cyanobacterium]
MTEGSSKDLTLFDKLRLYPDIVLDETINEVREELRNLLAKVNNPEEEDNAGLLLEDLAKMLLSSPYLKLNKMRRRTETSEIDLDFTVRRIEATLFNEFSYLLIIECKNWSKKVGAPQVRDFCSKMRKVGSNIGIVFSKKEITRDAKREIRDAWIQDKIVVLAFDAKDLEQIINGSSNLYEMFNRKYIAVRTASKE